MENSEEIENNLDPLQQIQANLEEQDSENEEPEDLFNDDQVTKTQEKQSTETPDADSGYTMEEGQDLFINVIDPEKHVMPMETFVGYTVKTRTTRSTFEDSEFKVQRRYQDFVWLRLRLEEGHPTHLIPPLPAKFVMKGMMDRFSETFINTRCMALNKFLDRLSRHPVLSFNDNLKVFLTAEQKEFVAHRKKYEGLMLRVSDSMKSLTSRTSSHDPEFTEVLTNVTDFGEQMGVACRVAERLLIEKKELEAELSEFSPTFTAWGSKENESISTIMNSVSSCLESCATAAAENHLKHETAFLPPLKEYILYSDAIKQVLKRRDIYHSQFDRCTEELQRKKDERENLPKSDQSYSISALLGKNAEEVKEQKESRLRQIIGEVSLKREQMGDELEKANSNLRADLDRWRNMKLQDMAKLFSDLGKSHITYHNECLAAWENILPSMQEKEQQTTINETS